MSTLQITIRHVPSAVRNELAARAALEGKSLQEYLLAELERLALRPTAKMWTSNIAEQKLAYGTRLSAKEILAARTADRR